MQEEDELEPELGRIQWDAKGNIDFAVVCAYKVTLTTLKTRY